MITNIVHKPKQHWAKFRRQLGDTITIIDSVNEGYSARLAFLPNKDDLYTKIRNNPKGVWYKDGGGVCNAYRYYAETTVVGCAWYTSPIKVLTVVLEHFRETAKQGPHGNVGDINPFGTDDPWSAVFPGRASRLQVCQEKRVKTLISKRGVQGQDDRLQIWQPVYSALSEEGFLIKNHETNPNCGCVVVTDVTTGQRHHIIVPPKFVKPKAKTFQKAEKFGKKNFGSKERGRVIAALAWTFGLKPEEYKPTIEV